MTLFILYSNGKPLELSPSDRDVADQLRYFGQPNAKLGFCSTDRAAMEAMLQIFESYEEYETLEVKEVQL